MIGWAATRGELHMAMRQQTVLLARTSAVLGGGVPASGSCPPSHESGGAWTAVASFGKTPSGGGGGGGGDDHRRGDSAARVAPTPSLPRSQRAGRGFGRGEMQAASAETGSGCA
jgi:hypothetical protein